MFGLAIASFASSEFSFALSSEVSDLLLVVSIQASLRAFSWGNLSVGDVWSLSCGHQTVPFLFSQVVRIDPFPYQKDSRSPNRRRDTHSRIFAFDAKILECKIRRFSITYKSRYY